MARSGDSARRLGGARTVGGIARAPVLSPPHPLQTLDEIIDPRPPLAEQLQTHYDTANLVAGRVDSSGVKVRRALGRAPADERGAGGWGGRWWGWPPLAGGAGFLDGASLCQRCRRSRPRPGPPADLLHAAAAGGGGGVPAGRSGRGPAYGRPRPPLYTHVYIMYTCIRVYM